MAMPILLAKLITALQEEPHTYADLLDATELSLHTVYRYIQVFKEYGLVHVGDWNESKRGSRCVRAWAWGPGPDAPKPAPKPRARSSKEWRQRQKVKAPSIFALGQRMGQQ
jgi:hypothetical protein